MAQQLLSVLPPPLLHHTLEVGWIGSRQQHRVDTHVLAVCGIDRNEEARRRTFKSCRVFDG